MHPIASLRLNVPKSNYYSSLTIEQHTFSDQKKKNLFFLFIFLISSFVRNQFYKMYKDHQFRIDATNGYSP